MRGKLLAACVLVAFAAPSAASAQGLPNHQRHVMSVGHADVLNITSHLEGFHVEVNDDAGDAPVIRKLDEVLLHAKPESRIDVPDIPEYAFLGDPGDPVWVMPEVQDPNLLWPGWNTEGVLDTEFPDPTITLRLLEVTGPGDVSVFTSDPVGNLQVIFDSAAPLPQTVEIINRSHTHANWAFEAEGLYRMKVQVEGRLADGRTITSPAHELRWFVGDLADLPPDVPSTTLTIDGPAERYTGGDVVTLRARQEPETGLTDVRWTRRCGDADPEQLGSGTQIGFTAAAEHDGCRVRATLHAADGTQAAAAADVTLRVQAPAVGDGPPPFAPPTAPTPGLTSAPAPPVSPARRLSHDLLGGSRLSLPALVMRGRATVPCRMPAAGLCTVRLTIAASAARRLGLKVKAAGTRHVLATGTRRVTARGSARVSVRLPAKVRRALRRARRTPALRLDVTATLANGKRTTDRAAVGISAR